MIKKILSFALVLSLATLLCACKKEEKKPDFSETKTICELATLKCFYHNTSELKVESSKWLKYLGKIGYKKAWIEYDGVVKLGVDASKVRIEPTDNKIKVYVPAATILSTDVDIDSISESVSETGWLTKITTEERAAAQGKAQDDMRAKVESNTALISQATQRAKEIIKGYILNTGNQIGAEYEIEWLEE